MQRIDEYLRKRYNEAEAFWQFQEYRAGRVPRDSAIYALMPLVERFVSSRCQHLPLGDRDDIRGELLAFIVRYVDTMEDDQEDGREFTRRLWKRFVEVAGQWKKSFHVRHYRDIHFDENTDFEELGAPFAVLDSLFVAAEREIDEERIPQRTVDQAKKSIRFTGRDREVCCSMLDRIAEGGMLSFIDHYLHVIGERATFFRSYCIALYKIMELKVRSDIQIGDMIDHLDQGIMYIYQIFEPYTLVQELLGWMCENNPEHGEDMFLDFLRIFGGSEVTYHGFAFRIPTIGEFVRNVEDVDIYLTLKEDPRNEDAVDRLAIRFVDTPENIKQRYADIAVKFNRAITELPHARKKT